MNPIPMLFAALLAQAPAGAGLPAGDTEAKGRLETSPRHGEYVDVPVEGSNQKIKTWVVYPERAEKAPVVLIIHEIFGLSDWIRAVADQLAADGYIAVAPDLISGKGPGGGNSDSVENRDDVVKLVTGLKKEEVEARLEAVRRHALSLPAASGKHAVMGFCWGGTQSFAYAVREAGLNAAVIFYGTSPSSQEDFARLEVPVLGLYGSDDARVNATIEPAARAMKELGKTYEYEIYEGAGHGFLRAQRSREGANLKAAERAWPRVLEFLDKHSK